MSTPVTLSDQITLDTLRAYKSDGRKFVMLTAYDYPTATLAQEAGVHTLLVGDSMGTVLLGHPSTRTVPLSLMVTLAEAVRRGAPRVYLVGDLPYEAILTRETGVLDAAKQFVEEAGCEAVKLEVGGSDVELVSALKQAGITRPSHTSASARSK
jgi:3-methyl-2-oxobutanoate hydroxymethyltransferase